MAIYPTPTGDAINGLGSTALSAASLVNPAVGIGASIGGQLLSNALDPTAKMNREQQLFQQRLMLYKLKQQNLNRQAALPGMYQTLGYSPDQSKTMTNAYTSGVQLPGATISSGKAKDAANNWVQNNQNPFDADMSGIDKQIQAGHLTPEEAVAQRQAKVQDYITRLNDYSTQGAHESQAARQSADTFQKYYGSPDQYGVDSSKLGNLGFMPSSRPSTPPAQPNGLGATANG